jgi:hypothetical protein
VREQKTTLRARRELEKLDHLNRRLKNKIEFLTNSNLNS